MGPIESVPKRKRRAALRHIVAGTTTGADIDQRAERYLHLFNRSNTARAQLWWICRSGRPQAVAMVLISKGHVGFLYHSPAEAPGVHTGALICLIRTASRSALEQGACMVQTMIAPSFQSDADALQEAGMEPLAELRHLRCDLSSPPPHSETPWTFVQADQRPKHDLMEVIERTYEGTLDCPRLTGLRSMQDVLASHKTTGIYTPRWWWLAQRKEILAGCILTNRTTNPSCAELVYTGVVPDFRREGLGRAMLTWCAQRIRGDGMRWLRLAVDENNVYARRLYERFGFVETGRKRCFVLLPPSETPGCE